MTPGPLRRALVQLEATRAQGFTLLELLVVLAILGLLAALVAPQVLGFGGRANSQVAQVQVRNLASAINTFQLDVGRVPTEAEGLGSLVTQPPGVSTWSGPYMERLPEDPWGHAYRYRVPGENGRPFDVYTLGADDAEGGTGQDRDIRN